LQIPTPTGELVLPIVTSPKLSVVSCAWTWVAEKHATKIEARVNVAHLGRGVMVHLGGKQDNCPTARVRNQRED
jgi:hypothetical protein